MQAAVTTEQNLGAAWPRAKRLAGATPEVRNRYVDFLRAGSITVVVLGHWLVAAPHLGPEGLAGDHLLALEPWTRWLTWAFQVMPIFFLVGGYSNTASWRSARAKNVAYAEWLTSRLRRLVIPVFPLLAFWVIVALSARAAGMDADLVTLGSQIALTPLWFLATYVMAVVLAPAAIWAWDRFGFRSLILMVGAALATDAAVFVGGLSAAGWFNFLFVWAAVHQLGVAWHAGWFSSRRAAVGALGSLALLLLAVSGPYPVSMVGVPGDLLTNNTPPTVALLTLAALQTGVVLTLEEPMRRWLLRPLPWTGTVLVNGFIMTLYLWHLTAMATVVGLSMLLGGPGLALAPASGAWWATRPLWLAVLATALVPFLALFSRFERLSGSAPTAPMPIVAAVFACGGFSLLALQGISNESFPYLNVEAIGSVTLAVILLRRDQRLDGLLRRDGRPPETAESADVVEQKSTGPEALLPSQPPRP